MRNRPRLASVTEVGSGGIKAELGGVIYPCSAIGDVRAGDTVPMAFALPDSNRQAILFGSPLISRSRPYLVSNVWEVLGLWPTPDGQPRVNLGPAVDSLTPFSIESEKQVLATLTRVESGGFTYSTSRQRFDSIGLLAAQKDGGPYLAAFFRVFESEFSSTSQRCKILEIGFSGGSSRLIDVGIHLRTAGFVGPNNRQSGFFFLREQDGKIYYTIQIGSSLISFERLSTSLVVTPVDPIRQAPGVFSDGSWAIAGTIAIDCRYTGIDLRSTIVRDEADRAMVRLFRQQESLKWNSGPTIDLRDFCPSVDGGELIRIFPVGLVSHAGVEDSSAAELHATWIGDGEKTAFLLPAGDSLGASILSVKIYDLSGGNSEPTYSYSAGTVMVDPVPNGHMLDVAYSLDEEKIEQQEFGFSPSLQASRWPALSLGNKREFWIHLACQHETSGGRPRHLQCLAIDQDSGAGLVWREGPEDWDGSEVIPGIVASQLATLQSQAATSRQAGAPESVIYNGSQAVGADCAPAGIPSVFAPLQIWLRGFFVLALDQGFTHPQSDPIFTQPQPDRFQYEEFLWGGLITENEEGSAKALSSSRQIASGCFDSEGNHYSVFNRACPYATGIATTTTSTRSIVDQSDRIFTYFQFPPEGEEYGGNAYGFVGTDEPAVNEGWSLGCVNDGPYTKQWLGDNVIPIRAFKRLWRTYLRSHAPDRSLRYRVDISLRYNLPNGWQNIPCHAGVWAFAALKDSLVLVRDEFWNRSGDTLISFDAEPCCEVRSASDGSLTHRVNLHPSSDEGRRYVPHPVHLPTMRLSPNSDGSGQAVICCRWLDSENFGDPAFDGHSFHLVDIASGASQDLFSIGLKADGFPSSLDLFNSVFVGGKLYWIDGAMELAKK